MDLPTEEDILEAVKASNEDQKRVVMLAEEIKKLEEEYMSRFGADKIWVYPSEDNKRTTTEILEFINKNYIPKSTIQRLRDDVSEYAFTILQGFDVVDVIRKDQVIRLLDKYLTKNV